MRGHPMQKPERSGGQRNEYIYRHMFGFFCDSLWPIPIIPGRVWIKNHFVSDRAQMTLAGDLAGTSYRTAVGSGAEIGLLSFRLSVSQGASLGNLLLAPACPIEKITLRESFLYLTPRSETDEGVAKKKVFARTGSRTRNSKSSKPQYTTL